MNQSSKVKILVIMFILLSSLVASQTIAKDRTNYWEDVLDIQIIAITSDTHITNLDEYSGKVILISYSQSSNTFEILQSEIYLLSPQIKVLKYSLNLNLVDGNEEELLSKTIDDVGDLITSNFELQIPVEQIEPQNDFLVQEEISVKDFGFTLIFFSIIFTLMFFFMIWSIFHSYKLKRSESKQEEDIKLYIHQMQEQGHNLTSIKLELVRHGYDQRLVDELSKAFKKSSL